MRHFGRRDRSVDPLWEVASATQVLVADQATIASLARGGDVEPLGAPVDGVVSGTRHPTGWFLHAVRRADLPDSEVGAFHELVVVRSYLLLAHGPQPPVWLRGTGQDTWRSVCPSLSRMLGELDDAFVD